MQRQSEVILLARRADKEMLQEASRLGQRDATYVLGMSMMVEGRDRKQDALTPLNGEFRNSRGTWNVRETCSRVARILSRELLKGIEFNECHLTYTKHPIDRHTLRRAYDWHYKWLFRCDAIWYGRITPWMEPRWTASKGVAGDRRGTPPQAECWVMWSLTKWLVDVFINPWDAKSINANCRKNQFAGEDDTVEPETRRRRRHCRSTVATL
ncbi:hypothetical protein LXL04_034661 [Taraxacum kok-saghyz]